jgi:hypothetical protein
VRRIDKLADRGECHFPFTDSTRADKRNRWIVFGRVPTGQCVQVVFTVDPPGMIYVIHAMAV